jgi:phosphoribosyl-ATP pyrophosphohydrolase
VSEAPSIFHRLVQVIEDRKVNPPERSYTTQLFEGGTGTIGAKIIEEASEVVEAAHEADQDPSHRSDLIHEACDLVYHLLVMLAYHNVKLSEVEAELTSRFGTSGLDERAVRNQPPD